MRSALSSQEQPHLEAGETIGDINMAAFNIFGDFPLLGECLDSAHLRPVIDPVLDCGEFTLRAISALGFIGVRKDPTFEQRGLHRASSRIQHHLEAGVMLAITVDNDL